VQGQLDPPGLVAQGLGDGVGPHDGAAVHLPEALRVQLRQQLAQRHADQVFALGGQHRTYLSAASK
jgi:hypothetical protein